MLFRYGPSKVGEYLLEKEKERLEQYRDRPWERESKTQTGGELLALMVAGAVCVGVLMLFALLF